MSDVSNSAPAPLTAKQSGPAMLHGWPISEIQCGLWLDLEQAGHSHPHNLGFTVVFDKTVNLHRWRQSVRSSVAARPHLLTLFTGSGTRILQRPAENRNHCPVVWVNDKQEVECIQRQLIETPFDLRCDVPFRSCILTADIQTVTFVWIAHHIVWDAISAAEFYREICARYRGEYVTREAPARPPGNIAPTRDTAAAERAIAHWREALRDIQPMSFPRVMACGPIGPRKTGRILKKDLNPVLIRDLQIMARRSHGTLFSAFAAGFGLLLSRYANTYDIVFGTAVDCRNISAPGAASGYYTNMVPIRLQIRPNWTIQTLVSETRNALLHALEHRTTQFTQIIDCMDLPRTPGRNPIFDVSLTLIEDPEEEPLGATCTTRWHRLHDGMARYDLSVSVHRKGPRWSVMAEYDQVVLEAGLVDRFLTNFTGTLERMTGEDPPLCGHLDGVSEQEHATIESFSKGQSRVDEDHTIASLFARQCATRPHAVAVSDRQGQHTFATMAARVHRLRKGLVADGVQAGDRVLILCERSADTTALILAILAVGATYVAVDRKSPPRRMKRIADDCMPALAVIDSNKDRALFDNEKLRLLADLSAEGIDQSIDSAPTGGPAYIVYTSGTTGEPKGIVIRQSSVVTVALSVIDAYGISPSDRVLQFSSLAFDVSVQEIFGSLLSGAELVIVPDDIKYDTVRLHHFLKSERITVAELPPSLCPHLYPEQYDALRLLSLGGEVVPPSVVAAWLQSGRQVFNGYGPSEATVVVTQMDCRYPGDGAERNIVPIGRPMPNVSTYILDENLRLTPWGGIGELCIAGPVLADGYLNRPDLTEDRFPVLIANGERVRVFRTGDLCVWTENHELLFLGRRDQQIQIRGYRVELAEIETVLRSEVDVSVAVVTTHTNGDLIDLAAFVAPRAIDTNRLFKTVSQHLPDYMIPRYLIMLDDLPKTRTGKIDRHALPQPTQNDRWSLADDRPVTSLERQIIDRIYGPVLGTDDLHPRDSFFLKGGSSLRATQVLARLSDMYGVSVSLADFFADSSARNIARLVEIALRRKNAATPRNPVRIQLGS